MKQPASRVERVSSVAGCDPVVLIEVFLQLCNQLKHVARAALISRVVAVATQLRSRSHDALVVSVLLKEVRMVHLVGHSVKCLDQLECLGVGAAPEGACLCLTSFFLLH